MSQTISRNFDEPDESLAFDHGRIDWVVIGVQTIGRTIQESGWNEFDDRGDHVLRGSMGLDVCSRSGK